MKALFLSLALTALASHAQDLREGMWQGFDGEWVHVSPRYHVHFTPTGSSWLNQIERWFAEITKTNPPPKIRKRS